MKRLLFILSLSTVVSFLNAQTKHFCGYETNSQDDRRIHKNLDNLITHKSGVETYVPIQFIIVSNQFNDGAVEEQEVINSLCTLNDYFADLDIRFYLKDNFKYIMNQIIFQQETNGGTLVNAEYNKHKVDGAVNVFIGGELATGNSGYYTSSSDVIYMDKRYINEQDVILAHELGHFFSLRHTFYGWENTIYNPEEPTPDEIFYRGEFRQVELVDRMGNCAEAADLLCDTPADYITNWNGGCNYSGGAVDQLGTPIDPDERNIMAYYSFANCSEYIFSEEQKNLMKTDLNNRPELINLDQPNLNAITEMPIAIFPTENDLVFDLENSTFEWTAVENADYYVFEVSFTSNFATTLTSFYTHETSATIDNLFDNFTFYWRVRAVSFVDPCEPVFSEAVEFSTDQTASIAEGSLNSISIYPNPNDGKVLIIDGVINERETNLTLYNLSGQKVFTLEKIESDQVDLPNLETGKYIVKLMNDNGVFTKSIVVSK